jgi:ribosome-binding factor A
MKGSSRRGEQVAETIRQVVSDALLNEVRDPRIKLVTVTRVEATGDLSWATVFVSVMTEDETERLTTLEGLESASGFLRSKLARSLSTRIVPELKFELDRGREHAARINAVLADLKREEPA